jgi:hypothetical protein
MATELKVELRDHVGQKSVKFGDEQIEVDIDFAQSSIMVNGKEIGLVCKKPGSPINFLPIANVFPPEARKKIAEAVKSELEKADGGSDRKVFDPPSEEAVAAANAAIAKQAAAENGDTPADETNL